LKNIFNSAWENLNKSCLAHEILDRFAIFHVNLQNVLRIF
jgi:hypothetical protein